MAQKFVLCTGELDILVLLRTLRRETGAGLKNLLHVVALRCSWPPADPPRDARGSSRQPDAQSQRWPRGGSGPSGLEAFI